MKALSIMHGAPGEEQRHAAQRMHFLRRNTEKPLIYCHFSFYLLQSNIDER